MNDNGLSSISSLPFTICECLLYPVAIIRDRPDKQGLQLSCSNIRNHTGMLFGSLRWISSRSVLYLIQCNSAKTKEMLPTPSSIHLSGTLFATVRCYSQYCLQTMLLHVFKTSLHVLISFSSTIFVCTCVCFVLFTVHSNVTPYSSLPGVHLFISKPHKCIHDLTSKTP